MIISRTPFRISFFGGGTDYPDWYKEHGGMVLATTINKYCYLTCRYLPPFFEHNIRLVYSQMENCLTIDDIKHPTVRETLRYLNFNRSVEIHHDADLPARSGIGSSSSFAVGLLHALHALEGRLPSKQQLSEQAIHVEQNLIKDTVGSQDQTLAAHGGFNYVVFHQSGEISIHPVPVSNARLRELNAHLLLFYTGIRRTASTIASSYVKQIAQRRRQLRLMTDLTKEALSIVASEKDISLFGELLHEGWQIKRSFSEKVSNTEVDNLYERGIKTGAIGGKLLGAGGGGFLLLFASPDRHTAIIQELDELVFVPFTIEFQGSQILFIDREEDFSLLEQHNVNRKPIYRELIDNADDQSFGHLA